MADPSSPDSAPSSTPDLYTAGVGNAVKVCARIRPVNAMERERGLGTCLVPSPDQKSIQHVEGGVSHGFAFDRVFVDSADQEDVYTAVAQPMIEGALNGFNGAILAYGQTGSGKTHTMQGCDEGEGRGLVPRMLGEMFDRIAATHEAEYDVRVSFLEVYNESMYDLLTLGKERLTILEDNVRGMFITGATEVPVTSAKDALASYYQGVEARKTFMTNMNLESSRSHAVFLLTISTLLHDPNITKYSQLYLVDLAGSEKVWKTGAEGDRLEEAKFINKSLLALGNVIEALSKRSKHVPYRDSKLTRLLKNSLGGNSRTCLVVCLSPNEFNAQETLSTLRFGDRTQRIVNVAVSNEVLGAEQLQAILDGLHRKIAKERSGIHRTEFEFRQWVRMFSHLGVSFPTIQAFAGGALEYHWPEMSCPDRISPACAAAADAVSTQLLGELQARSSAVVPAPSQAVALPPRPSPVAASAPPPRPSTAVVSRVVTAAAPAPAPAPVAAAPAPVVTAPAPVAASVVAALVPPVSYPLPMLIATATLVAPRPDPSPPGGGKLVPQPALPPSTAPVITPLAAAPPPTVDTQTVAEAGTPSAAATPAVWRATTDASTGKTYWYNKVTRETQWFPPVGVEVAPPPAQPVTTTPGVWKEVFDARSGKAYFFNTATRQTSWVKPPAA